MEQIVDNSQEMCPIVRYINTAGSLFNKIATANYIYINSQIIGFFFYKKVSFYQSEHSTYLYANNNCGL